MSVDLQPHDILAARPSTAESNAVSCRFAENAALPSVDLSHQERPHGTDFCTRLEYAGTDFAIATTGLPAARARRNGRQDRRHMTDGHCFPSSMPIAAVTQSSVCVTADGFDHPIAGERLN
jgi:hypothetical protein